MNEYTNIIELSNGNSYTTLYSLFRLHLNIFIQFNDSFQNVINIYNEYFNWKIYNQNPALRFIQIRVLQAVWIYWKSETSSIWIYVLSGFLSRFVIYNNPIVPDNVWFGWIINSVVLPFICCVGLTDMFYHLIWKLKSNGL